jgi:hypothetical protein
LKGREVETNKNKNTFAVEKAASSWPLEKSTGLFLDVNKPITIGAKYECAGNTGNRQRCNDEQYI